MKIVEYNDSYAHKVAEMWNKSNSSWGNVETIQSATDVIAAESSSGNIKLYLAIDNDQVIGYCSISEYKYDEGASYLPLINVIPEYHGKKVGKALILKVIDDAIASRWPRFDLFTWSGNIKAMPLYKKCGFFWERRNNTVHLMNFIPYLHQSEALIDYLDKVDWYKDSIRVIDLEQDGDERNGFDYYRYDFENKDTKLSMEFEKTGRGLRYIETPDYLIEMSIKEHDLVFDHDYEVDFRIVNKSNKDLEINFKGKDNKNIKFTMNKTINVIDEDNVCGSFYVGEIDKDQIKDKTHPVVETEILINGKLVNFKIGIEPKYPIKIKLNVVEYNHIFNKEYNCYLDIENNLNTKESFFITLPNSFVEFKDEIKVNLESKEKKSIKLTYSLKNYGFYNEFALIRFNDKLVEKQVSVPFKGSSTSFTGTIENKSYIFSGNYVVAFDINSHNMAITNGFMKDSQSAFFVPQIGMPYSLEFNNSVPKIQFISNNDMDIIFSSESFKDVQLIIHVNHSFGLLTVNYELINNGHLRELALSIPFWVHLEDCVIPYEGKLLEVIGTDGSDIQSIYHEKVDENWIYNKKHKYGVTWDKNQEMKISDWKLTFDKENIKLNNGESYISPSIYCSYVHSDVKDFRAFAGNLGDKEKVEYLEVIVNKGNPFASENVGVSVKNNRKTEITGTLCIDDLTVPIESALTVDTGLKEIEVSIKDRSVTFKRLVHNVEGKINLIEKDGILEVSNGVLSFKASNDYADSIYSLKFDGFEWLDSNYPNPKERVWWADFVGGITQRLQGIQDIAALKEERSAEFVKLTDNFGNEWEGIKVSLNIQKDPDLKGLVIDSYCLTLPGIKLIHTFTNVTNYSGKLLLNKGFHRFTTLNIDENPKDVRFKKNNILYKCNDINVEIFADKLALFEGNRSYKLGLYNKKNNLFVETKEGYTIIFSEGKMTVPDKESKQFSGEFIFFTKSDLEKECLVDLENINFIV